MKGLFVGLAALLVAGVAHGADSFLAGDGTFSGIEKLKMPRCGSHLESAGVTFALAVNGDWSAVVDGNALNGTSTKSGSVVNLSMATDSVATLMNALTPFAIVLCEEPVPVVSLSATTANLKLNKRRTAARFRFTTSVTRGFIGPVGSSPPPRGRYDLKAAGVWDLLAPFSTPTPP